MPTNEFIAADRATALSEVSSRSIPQGAKDAATDALNAVVDSPARRLLVNVSHDMVASGASFEVRRIAVTVASIEAADGA